MLIATGIMAIGLVMVATIFPVGVKLTSMSTERTIGAVVADEAFAKVQLYGVRSFLNWPSAQIALNNNDPRYAPNWADATYDYCDDFLFTNLYDLGPDEQPGTLDDLGPGFMIDDTGDFLYPSAAMPAGQDRNYHWSALCRRVGAKEVQVTVFVTRKIAAASQYRAWDYAAGAFAPLANPWPKPIPVSVDFTYSAVDQFQNQQLVLTDPQPNIQGYAGFTLADCRYFFDDGYTIVDDLTGKIYRVLEVKDADGDNFPDTLVLMDDWEWIGHPLAPTGSETRTIWVVPPAIGSDRYPCVGVYQKTIRFDEIN